MKYTILFTMLISLFGCEAKAMSCDDLLSDVSIDSRPLKISEINYQVFGNQENPPLILIHGLDSAWQTFSNVTDELSNNYYVIVYDQRGHGLSHDGGLDFSSALLAEDLLVLMDHLNINTANILGHSMGARTAVRFAALYPDRVTSLVVEDMELHQRVAIVPEKRSQIEARAEQLRQMPKTFKSREDLVTALKPVYGNEAESLSYRRAKQNSDGTFELLFRPSVTLLYGYQGNTEDLIPAFISINAPVLVMQASPTRGTALTAQGIEYMRAVKPNAIYTYFENAGHTIHRTDQDGFLNILDAFLENNSNL